MEEARWSPIRRIENYTPEFLVLSSALRSPICGICTVPIVNMDGLSFQRFRRRLEGESVFGMASDIDAKAAASVFIGLTILLVLLELGFTKLEHWAENHSCKELFEKLKKELTMMGILSFTVFIYQTAYDEATESDYYEAFEMSHIIILFIAIAFIIQASFLLHFAIKEGDNFLKTSRTTSEDLLIQYSNMKKTSKLQTWFFQHAPYWFPTIPSFRNDIRNKLMELLFIEQHKLPDEFRFAQYISKLFQKYISELGEVSWINWIILGALVGFNYVKIATLDAFEINLICGNPAPAEGGKDRRLKEEEGENGEEVNVCFSYIFQYGIFEVCLLVCFLQGIYVLSSYYFEELLVIACNRQNIPVTKEEGRHAYIEILERMAGNGDEEERTAGRSTDNKDEKVRVFQDAKPSTQRRQSVRSSLKNPLLANDTVTGGGQRDDIDAALLEDQLQNIQEIAAERDQKTTSFCQKILCWFGKSE